MDILGFTWPGLAEILVIIVALAFSAILPVIAFWKICSKAGFSGALGLLMIVPIANVILPLYVAFSEWPALASVRPSPEK